MRALIAVLVLAAGSPSFAQQIELTPLASYSTTASIDKRAPRVEDVSIDGGFTWGGAATYFVSPHVGLEAQWIHESTRVSMSMQSERVELLRMRTNQLGGNVVYQFRRPEARWRPFAFSGLGATFFSASDVDDETRASWTIGGGLKWLVQGKVGMRLQGRYASTIMDDESATFCGPFGFCQQALRHIELAGGAVFRF